MVTGQCQLVNIWFSSYCAAFVVHRACFPRSRRNAGRSTGVLSVLIRSFCGIIRWQKCTRCGSSCQTLPLVQASSQKAVRATTALTANTMAAYITANVQYLQFCSPFPQSIIQWVIVLVLLRVVSDTVLSILIIDSDTAGKSIADSSSDTPA